MAMYSVRAPRALGITLFVALGACGTTSSNDDSGPLVQVAEVSSQSGTYEVAMLAHSPSPARGSHTLELVVTSMQDSTPVDGLALTLVPWMPAMGHGTSIVPSVTPLGDGTYELDDVDLYMAGLWGAAHDVHDADGLRRAVGASRVARAWSRAARDRRVRRRRGSSRRARAGVLRRIERGHARPARAARRRACRNRGARDRRLRLVDPTGTFVSMPSGTSELDLQQDLFVRSAY